MKLLLYSNLLWNWDSTLCGIDPTIAWVSLRTHFVLENLENHRNHTSWYRRIIFMDVIHPMNFNGSWVYATVLNMVCTMGLSSDKYQYKRTCKEEMLKWVSKQISIKQYKLICVLWNSFKKKKKCRKCTHKFHF